ncbi:MAG: Fic family protein [Elusimicrobium sp.]|jgi:Fic family protein|nr:Fic family protein [Elusimicrobium sp.]
MKPFIPQKLPINNLDWQELIGFCDGASSNIYRYDGLLEGMINPEILLSPLIRKEAELSSKIEGTQSTMSDVLEYESGAKFDSFKEKEIQGLQNYRISLRVAEDYLKEGRPLSLSLIKELHKRLMKDAHWDARSLPGEFRKEQVFIGSRGCNIETATYVPPEHFLIQEYLENWEEFVQNNSGNKIIKAAIIHAQFEIIHPFMDGNGRIGRMIIPLYLYLTGVLQRPMFYISEYFEKNRTEYYARLAAISQHNDWQGWVEFFLRAVEEQSRINILRARKISNLYEDMKGKFQKTLHSQHYLAALECLFKRPIINGTLFTEKTRINHPNTARNILNKLEKAGYIEKIRTGGARRSALYAFPQLLFLANESNMYNISK